MYGDGGIAKHGFGASGGDFDEFWFGACGVGRPAHSRESLAYASGWCGGHHRIAEVPELAFDRFLKDFVVADGGLQERVPVHEPLAAVNEALAEQIKKRLPHGTRAAFVERE